jgi:activator of HSP90 ATPase
MSKPIRQTVTFKAKANDVYEALMDSRKHARFTGRKAKISRKIGGEFNVHDGYITGKNLELVPDKLIVQEWRASEWPAGVTSKVTFALTKIKGGTRLSFRHTGVPAEHHDGIKQGWIDSYWTPMKKLLEK